MRLIGHLLSEGALGLRRLGSIPRRAATLACGVAIGTPLAAQQPQPPRPAQAQTPAANMLPITPITDMPLARGFHGAAVLGDFVYIIGGSSGTGEKSAPEAPDLDVWRGKILPNGDVTEWAKTTPLPSPRYYIANSTLVLNDVVYIFGGSDKSAAGTRYKTAIWSKPLPNGTLTPWQTSQPMPEEVSLCASVSTPGHIHVIGGEHTDNTISPSVWTNSVYPDGSLSTWEPGPALPTPLWYHNAGVVAGRVYVWGGLNSDEANKRIPLPYIFSAPIRSSGKLGPWRTERVMLPVGFYCDSSTVAGPYLMSFMPRYEGGKQSNDVWFTRITPRGMDPWNARPAPVPNRVYHAVAPNYREGSIFITGGRSGGADSLLLRKCSFFLLNGQARKEAEQSWLAAETAHSNSVSALAAQLQSSGAPAAHAASAGRGLSYIADLTLQEGAVPGFMTVTEARARADKEKLPLILYFLIKGAAPCDEQKNLLMNNAQFAELTKVACFAWIDATEYPQLCQQIGVYRAPTWVFYTAAGDEFNRKIGVMSPIDIAAGILLMKQ